MTLDWVRRNARNRMPWLLLAVLEPQLTAGQRIVVHTYAEKNQTASTGPPAGQQSTTGGTNFGVGPGAPSMMIVIGLALASLLVSILVVLGTVTRFRRQGPQHARSTPAGDGARPAEGTGGQLPMPAVPILVVQPDGQDLACAYQLESKGPGDGKHAENETVTEAERTAEVLPRASRSRPTIPYHVASIPAARGLNCELQTIQ